MFEKFDAFNESILHVPLRFLCKLTGRSNYFFAIFTVIISVLVYLLYNIHLIMLNKFHLSDMLFCLTYLLFAILQILLYLSDQKIVESSPENNYLSDYSNNKWIVRRTILVISGLMIYPISIPLEQDVYISLISITILLVATSIYFAADTTPRGKGWLRQKAEALAKATKNIKVPSLRPIPPPIPS